MRIHVSHYYAACKILIKILQLSPEGTEVRYVLLVYEAEEFCKLVINESLLGHVTRVQNRYPSYTICYLTNKLMAYINKR